MAAGKYLKGFHVFAFLSCGINDNNVMGVVIKTERSKQLFRANVWWKELNVLVEKEEVETESGGERNPVLLLL